MSNFNPNPILNLIKSYWRDFYEDRPKLERLWDAFARVFDDEWAQLEQINDSSNVQSVPDFIYHTYLHRTLEDWESYGVPHNHFKKAFRATAAQTIFYIGDWPDPKVTRIYLNGKELDSVKDPYILTFEQDGTQPSVNPAGARIVFTNPLTLNDSVILVSDKLLVRGTVEVPVGGTTIISLGNPVDEWSLKVTLEKLNITRFLTVETNKFKWASTGVGTDTRIFRSGETFEVIDGTTRQIISLSADTDEVAIPTPVTPGTTVVYKMLDFEITNGKVFMDGPILRASGQTFPVSSRVRVRDGSGAKGVEVNTVMDAINFGREFDEPGIFMYGGKISESYEVTGSDLVFDRSFMEGMVIVVEATTTDENDHAHERIVITQATDEVSVPPTRPFVLKATLLEDPNFPILAFVDGMLIPPDLYIFKPGAETTTIKLNSPMIFPVGSVVDLYYVDKEDPVPHLHVQERFVVGVPTSAFSMSNYLQDRFQEHVVIDGVCVSDPAIWRFTPDGWFLNFATPLPTGTIVKARGARTSYHFHHTIDPEIVRADYLQNGIDQRSGSIPAGWTIQLKLNEGFAIGNGLLESDEPIENVWFKDVWIDEGTGYKNFGFLMDFWRPTSAEYVKVLRAIFAGNYMGSQPQTLENFVNIILGSDYLRRASTVESINQTTLIADGEEYSLDPKLPVRANARESYERFYALSSYAYILDKWEPFDLLSIMAERFSPDYRFGKNLDIHRPAVFSGGPVNYDRGNRKLLDPDVDFFEWEVWPGDLIRMYAQFTPTVPRYARVKTVERHALGVDIDLGNLAIGYGEGDYGEYTYGGALILEQVDSYTVWSRQTDRLDIWRFLDNALPEEIPYLMERFTDLLKGHVFLVKILWEALRDGQAVGDVKGFLDRAKPDDVQYIGYSEAYEDGLTDELEGDLSDDDPEREEIPAFLFVSTRFGGHVGITGQTNPNVGSFVGVRSV